jgi:hypothetical protein
LRNGFEAKRLAEEGVLAGFPDVAHLRAGSLFLLEFKREGERRKKNGGLSDAQVDLHPRLVAAGARLATVYSLEEAKQQARAWRLTINVN